MRHSSVVDHLFIVRWVFGSIPYGGPIELFVFQPLLCKWCNKSRNRSYPLCGIPVIPFVFHINLQYVLYHNSSNGQVIYDHCDTVISFPKVILWLYVIIISVSLHNVTYIFNVLSNVNILTLLILPKKCSTKLSDPQVFYPFNTIPPPPPPFNVLSLKEPANILSN